MKSINRKSGDRGVSVLKLTIFVFWLAMMGLLIYREAGDIALGPLASPLSEEDINDEDAWFGIYFLNEQGGKEEPVKIGYSHLTRKAANPGYILEEDTRLKLTVQKEKKTVRSKLTAAVDADYRLISFSYELSSDLIKFRLDGELKGGQLLLDVVTAGATRQQVIPLEDGAADIPINLVKRLVAKGLKVGGSYSLKYFDPGSMAVDLVNVDVLRKEMLDLGGMQREVYYVRMQFQGIPIESWIDTEGNLFKERAASMMTVRENRKYALSRGWGEDMPLDIIDLASIRVDEKIDRPRQASSLTVRMSGVDFSGMPLNGPRQTFNDGLLSVNLEEVGRPPTYDLPYTESDLAEFLAATPTLQSDDPEIIDTAKRIIGDRTDALEVSRALADWVFTTLDKKPIVSIPSAKDVLLIKRGDCNEHAALLTALARAVGLPAKILVGIVYNDGSFYYHAWNALFVGRWVAVDATFGQFPADATHIRFLEGDLDQQVGVARLFGKLQLEVIEAK